MSATLETTATTAASRRAPRTGQTDDVQAARHWAAQHEGRPLGRIVNVLVDGSGRVGPLSYLAPAGMELSVGAAVEVPFGKRQAYGIVLGPGDRKKATREITAQFGQRASASEIAAAQLIANRHFVELDKVVRRLSPTSGKGADPTDAGPVALAGEATEQPLTPDLSRRDDDYVDVLRRFAARPPGQDPAHWAARIAAGLAEEGQVLVLCPTLDLVDDVVASFTSGAARIDSRASRGAWRGFNEGTVRVGVGTRSAALFSAPELAAIVVVEQDRAGHIEPRMPNTHARDVALLRSLVCDVPLISTGSVPTPPALHSGVKLIETADVWPEITLIDRSQLHGSQRTLPVELASAIARELKAGRTPLALIERARAIHRCDRCNQVRRHEDCPTAVDCSYTFDACGTCGETDTRPVGWDEARLHKLFNGQVTPVTLAALQTARNVGLVIIYDLDAVWRTSDLSPDTRAASLLMTAATAAGQDGTVIALTSETGRDTVVALADKRSLRTLGYTLWQRYQRESLPPFGRLVTVRVARKNPPDVSRWPGRVLGPRRTPDGFEILVQIAPDQLARLAPHVGRLQRGGRCRITVG